MTSTPRPRRDRWRWIAALTAVLVAGLTGVGILLAVTAHPGTANADPLCDQMRREHGPYWPCINVPTYTPLPTQYTAPPTATTGDNGSGPKVGGEPGPGPGTGNGTPIIPVPGYRAPGLPGQKPPPAPRPNGQQPAPRNTQQPTRPSQTPRPSAPAPGLTLPPAPAGASRAPTTLSPADNTPAEVPAWAWVLAGAAAIAAAAPWRGGATNIGRGAVQVEAEVPYPITDGIDYLYPGSGHGLSGTWGGASAPDVVGTGRVRFIPTGPKSGRVEFHDDVGPIDLGPSKATSNKIGVWVNGKDVTDQAQITRTANGIRGSVDVKDGDTVQIRHKMDVEWTRQVGNVDVRRKNQVEVQGHFKAAIDEDAMETAHHIAYNSHSWSKHAHKMPTIRNQSEFENVIYETIRWAPPQDRRTDLKRGRSAYWNALRGLVIIDDPMSPDGGTAFPPDKGRGFFEGLK